MPRLVYFVASSAAIQNSGDGTISLITLLDTINVPVPANVEMPLDAVIPMPWTLVSHWSRQPGDEERRFEQRTQLVVADGRVMFPATQAFHFERQAHRITVQGRLFPIGCEGEVQMQLAFREVGGDQGWQDVANYPVNVVYQPLDMNQPPIS